MSAPVQLTITFSFLLANILVLWIILGLNRREGRRPSQPLQPMRWPDGGRYLPAADILGKEYEYAQATASEAMKDRHQMMNFYLIFVGVVFSGVVATASAEPGSSTLLATVLLWLLSSVGWLYFLKLVRLRQAWYDSARAMNRIKEFYIQHAADIDGDLLRSAFLWQTNTLPEPGRPWTLFHLSAMTIGFLDSVAFVLGGMFLDLSNLQTSPLMVLGLLALMGVGLLAFYGRMYAAFLRTTWG